MMNESSTGTERRLRVNEVCVLTTEKQEERAKEELKQITNIAKDGLTFLGNSTI